MCITVCTACVYTSLYSIHKCTKYVKSCACVHVCILLDFVHLHTKGTQGMYIATHLYACSYHVAIFG